MMYNTCIPINVVLEWGELNQRLTDISLNFSDFIYEHNVGRHIADRFRTLFANYL